jgi:hypothetical protein
MRFTANVATMNNKVAQDPDAELWRKLYEADSINLLLVVPAMNSNDSTVMGSSVTLTVMGS